MATQVDAVIGAANAVECQAAVTQLEAFATQSGVTFLKDGSVLASLKAGLEESGKKQWQKRENACVAFSALSKAIGAPCEPHLVPYLRTVLKLCGDKEKSVRTAACGSAKTFVASLPPFAVKTTLPIVLSSMDSSEKFQTVMAACDVLVEFAQASPVQTAASIPELVPVVSRAMNDMKEEVRASAKNAMKECADTIDNSDISDTVSLIVDSVSDMQKVPETIHKLASTTFVQTVDGSALGIIAPLLLRGLREKVTATRRMCGVIVNNMSKLVEIPSEAAPFLPELLPAMERAKDEVSDPEARGVCQKAFEQLKSIEAACKTDKNGKKVDFTAVNEALKAKVGGTHEFNLAAVEYAASLACSMGDSRMFDQLEWQKLLTGYLGALAPAEQVATAIHELLHLVQLSLKVDEEEEEGDDAEVLCNCQFTLAYGTKILLHNTPMKLKRGYKYGLLGPNDCGKSTLMRSIVNGQVEGFPDGETVRTVFVEADILGELSDLCCLDYVFADARIKKAGVPREEVAKVMLSVGFTEKMLTDKVTTLSGGWRMKLALSRAMLQKADILLMDEPTNHLDVINVKWVMDYLQSLTNVTCIMVSHHAQLLNTICSHIIQIKDLKLHMFKGSLDEFVEKNPEARSFFEFKATRLKFSFPQPGFIEGVKHKSTALMKMKNCEFTYPGNTIPTVSGVTCQVSLSSRVACVGRNGAGKSTMIKLLTGETTPDETAAGGKGLVWKHPNARVAYVAQHAFHHIEQHLDKTPNEYIRWRYQSGEDKEALQKDALKLTPEEEELIKKPMAMDGGVDKKGNPITIKRVIEKLTGGRKDNKKLKMYEYEVTFEGASHESNQFILAEKLLKMGFEKHMKATDAKIAMQEGVFKKPLTIANVEKHMEDVGLEREYGSHYRMSALSGGQKVKVVLAAAMWNSPHIVILDEPTNYLDRESLGALAGAIEEYAGGVVMISHNAAFCAALCPETWLVENDRPGLQPGTVTTKGDAEWMANVMKEKQAEVAQVDTMVDALGNESAVKAPKKQLSRQEKKKRAKVRAAKIKRGEAVSDEDEEEED